MAHFYGRMQGARGETTRTGTKASGVSCHVSGWGVGGRAEMFHAATSGDVAELAATSGSNGRYNQITVAEVRAGEGGLDITLMDRPEVRAAAWRLLGSSDEESVAREKKEVMEAAVAYLDADQQAHEGKGQAWMLDADKLETAIAEALKVTS